MIQYVYNVCTMHYADANICSVKTYNVGYTKVSTSDVSRIIHRVRKVQFFSLPFFSLPIIFCLFSSFSSFPFPGSLTNLLADLARDIITFT